MHFRDKVVTKFSSAKKKKIKFNISCLYQHKDRDQLLS